jgi:hypothetical protein
LRRSLTIELAIVTLSTLVVIHALFIARGVPFISAHLSYFVAYILVGVPIAVLWFRRRALDYFSISPRDLLTSALAFLVVSIIVFPPFLLVAHGWMRLVVGADAFHLAGFPDFGNLLLVQVLIVALPEEFFFRGYFQSTMDMLFEKRWKIFGTCLGWGWLITAIVFAFAHSLIVYQWWHFSIFFPALVFGFLRERTGNIIAPTLFHAASNLLMNWFVRCYS